MATQCLHFITSHLNNQLINTQNHLPSIFYNQQFQILKQNTQIRETSIRTMLKLNQKYKFKHDTLFLAIHILDQLLISNFHNSTNDAQLLAGVLIILSTKYNEVYPVVIDQINLNITKFYPRQTFYQIQGQILEAIGFQIPSSTIYSQLYNKLEPNSYKRVNLKQEKQNQKISSNTSNIDTDCSQKDDQLDLKDLGLKTLQIIKKPSFFKYGCKILQNALLSYFAKYRNKSVLNMNERTKQIKCLIRKQLDGNEQNEQGNKVKIMSGTSIEPKIRKSSDFIRSANKSNKDLW